MAHTRLSPAYVSSPLLYWTTLAYIVGIPNFVHFDPTGRTADPINFSSVMNIIQTVLSAALLIVLLALERRPVIYRRLGSSRWLWAALLAQFTLATLLQPSFRFTAAASTDLVLSLFLLSQWVIAFGLIATLYARTLPGHGTELMVSLIGRTSWIWIAMVWLILPVMPQQVYGDAGDTAASFRQLGGQLLHPGKLAMLAGVAFFYALLFFKPGLRRWMACAVALITLAMTVARTGQLAFLVALLLYALVLSRKTVLRWVAGVALGVSLVGGLAFRSLLMGYVARGQSAQSLATLDDRTRIWSASWEAIRMRPLMGYGYVVGAKKALRDHWIFVHWIPPHAHNEFIQAMVAGGLIALLLTISLYAVVLWSMWRDARRGTYKQFLLLTYVLLLITALSGPLISYRYMMLDGILLLCFIEAAGRSTAVPHGIPSSPRVRSAVRELQADLATR